MTAEKVKAEGTVYFGQEKIIDVSGLQATVNGQTGKPGEGFFVRYAMEQTRTVADAEYPLEQPNAGSAKFCVYYTGMGFENVEVVKGSIYVNPKPYADLQIAEPQAIADLTETSGDIKEEQNLITAGSVDGIAMEYSLEENGEYSTAVPKAAENGVYRVYYRSPENGNYEKNVKGYVDVVIRPYLTATYGETLADVEARIHSDGTWAFEAPKETTKVGNVTQTGNSFKMSYTPKDANAPTVTNCDVVIQVKPAHIALEVELVRDRYHKYTGAEIKPSVSVKVKQDDNAQELVENDEFPETEYTLQYSSITNAGEKAPVNPGKAKVTVVSAGNYVFDNTAEELTEEYIIFRAGSISLADTQTAVPPELKSLYKTGAEMKQVLGENCSENFPETMRRYVKYLMMDEDRIAVYDEFYWPDGGWGTLSWDYVNGFSKNDTFEIYGMYLVTSERLGTEAGEIFRMTETDDSTPDTNEYYVGEDGIKFRLKNYAALCFAAEVDPNAAYSITTKAKNGTVSFAVGSDTTKMTQADAVRVNERITVTPTPNSGYAVTSVKYTYKEGSQTVTVPVEQNSSGKYVFEMPAKDIVLTATFAKKTSSSKNPYSGDTSGITLWLMLLAVSGAGAAALVAFWFRKRKK